MNWTFTHKRTQMKTYIFLALALFGVQLSFAQNSRGAAEVFIQIEDSGNFTISLDNESISSAKGRFRFYDVYNPFAILTISQGNRQIFSRKIEFPYNQRSVYSFSLRRGLRLNQTLTIYRNGQYALNDFDDYVGAYNTGIVPPRQTNGFDLLQAQVKRESFDSGKASIIQAYAKNNYLTTAQVSLLFKNFNQDNVKLELAKSLVPAIADIQNYYTLREAFTFLSSKDEFMQFLTSSQSPRAERLMGARTYEQLIDGVKKTAFDDEKTKLIEAAIRNAAPTTSQIKGLLALYTFEDKALDCAKLAYNYVYDRKNYFTLADAFKFDRTKNAFLDFLNQQ